MGLGGLTNTCDVETWPQFPLWPSGCCTETTEPAIRGEITPSLLHWKTDDRRSEAAYSLSWLGFSSWSQFRLEASGDRCRNEKMFATGKILNSGWHNISHIFGAGGKKSTVQQIFNLDERIISSAAHFGLPWLLKEKVSQDGLPFCFSHHSRLIME